MSRGNDTRLSPLLVDRLSRSLLDFTKIIEIFDRHKVAFVSVTQAFNTATSMGRLILNVLLSFAQFEREMISERTRDKMSAARRKGKWVGGTPILGYTVQNSKLMVDPLEAVRVREIFELYLGLKSSLAVAKEINDRGWRKKQWTTKKGSQIGGSEFNKNAICKTKPMPIANAIFHIRLARLATSKQNFKKCLLDSKEVTNRQSTANCTDRVPRPAQA